MKKITLSVVFSIVFFALKAQDTFSIVAVDSASGEVGGAGASCIGAPQIPQGCSILSDIHIGKGVIHSQASYIAPNQANARDKMNQGLSPAEIIAFLQANDAQGDSSVRQYGIVDFDANGKPRTAAFTGKKCLDYKNHIIGKYYTIQGNILLGQMVLDSMEKAFLRTKGTLTCKLMAAMLAAKIPGADSRCLSAGISSLSAFIKVAKKTDQAGSLYIDINVPSVTLGIDPIDELYRQLQNKLDCKLTTGSVNELKEAKKMFVSFHPETHTAQVSLPEHAYWQIELRNLQGQTLLKTSFAGHQYILLTSAYASGTYVLVMQAAKQSAKYTQLLQIR